MYKTQITVIFVRFKRNPFKLSYVTSLQLTCLRQI